MVLLRYLKAELIKTRRLRLRTAHLLIPVAAAAVFIAYYSYSPWSVSVKLSAYFQTVGAALPFLAALFCSLLAQQERAAGGYQLLLGAPVKVLALLAKLILPLLWALGSLLGASLLFGWGFGHISGGAVSISTYLRAALLLWACCVPLYALHMYLSLAFGQGLSLGVGLVEALTAALLLTDLGAGIWFYLPAVWPARAVSALLASEVGQLTRLLPLWAAVCCISLAAYALWASRWEGAGRYE